MDEVQGVRLGMFAFEIDKLLHLAFERVVDQLIFKPCTQIHRSHGKQRRQRKAE